MRKCFFVTLLMSLSMPLLLTLTSCDASKKISYFQDAQLVADAPAPLVEDLLIQQGDKVQFMVKIQGNSALSNLFYYNVSEENEGGGELGAMNYYIVDDEGDVFLPVVGKIHAAGLKRYELEQRLKQSIMDNGFKSVAVTATLLNAGVTFVGEVNRPGRLSIDNDNITILEALALAKDLTLNGRRDNIVVVRNVGGTDKVYQLDLRSLKQVVESPAYYLQNNDIVYVQPTKKRVREAVNSGNDVYTASFWLQMSSLEIRIINLLDKIND